MLRATLMWTKNDFPAYMMLSGWMMQGKLACPTYMENTIAFTVNYDGKNSWFDYHRKFLGIDHTYRHSRYGFRKNTIESKEASVRLTGQQIWDKVKQLPKIIEVRKSIRLLGYRVECTIGLHKVYSGNYTIRRMI